MSEVSSAPYYFAYGSNMSVSRMKARNIPFHSRQPALLNDFELVFNIKDSEMRYPEIDCLKGYANICPKKQSKVEGFVYGIENDSLEKLALIEIGYKKILVTVKAQSNKLLQAVTMIGEPEAVVKSLLPPSWYMNYLVEAASELSSSYQDYLNSFEVLNEEERLN